jgi:tetratricopeptide (TPR) repeat protein
VIDSKLANVPKDAREHFRRGVELSGENKTDEAIREFRLAIAGYPQFTPCYVELGKTYLKANKLKDAVDTLQIALKNDPNDFNGRLNLGIALLNDKRFDEAEKELVTAAYLNRTAVTPHYYLGVMYIEKKDLDIAQKALETARGLAGEKSFPLLHKYLGGVYMAKKMNKQAAGELEKYLQQEPEAKDADRVKKTISELKKKN